MVAAGAGEIWLVMQALGQPLGMIDSFILESLGSGIRAAAFMLPRALGALEGGFVLFGALFGLPADTALAISLSNACASWPWASRACLSGIGSRGIICCAGARERTPIKGVPVRSTLPGQRATATD